VKQKGPVFVELVKFHHFRKSIFYCLWVGHCQAGMEFFSNSICFSKLIQHFSIEALASKSAQGSKSCVDYIQTSKGLAD
jgi:hypothetical protein